MSEACIKAKVTHYAELYAVSPETMWRIMKCENPKLDPKKQSDYHYPVDHPELGLHAGDQEQSYGLVQIHLPAHPSITYEEATDVDFSIEFLARALSQNQGWMWTCY